MPPTKVIKKRKRADLDKSCDKPEVKRSCLQPDYETDSDENIMVEEPDEEQEIKIFSEFFYFKTAIVPEMQKIDKFHDSHLWKQEHKYESTFSGVLEEMENEMKVLQKTGKEIRSFLRVLLELSQKEALNIREALEAINTIRTKRLLMLGGAEIGRYLRFNDYIKDVSKTAPLWMGLTNEIAPPLCGAIPPPDNHEFKVGHLVAAHVIMETDETVYSELGIIGKWILCIIVGVNGSLYIVKDMDGTGITYDVARKLMIALPLYIADPEANPEAIYPEDSLVLALYSDTTCFFSGIIAHPPKTKAEGYKIRFKNGLEMEIHQQFVIPYKDVYSIYTDEEKKDLIRLFGKTAVMPISKMNSRGSKL